MDHVYVKSIRSFETIARDQVLGYSLVLGGSGSVTIAKSNENRQREYAGQWLLAGDQVFYVKAAKPDAERITLTIAPPWEAFTRPVNVGGLTYGEAIEAAMQHYVTGDGDAEYAHPYMTVTATDRTPAQLVPDDYGYITPSELMQDAIEHGVLLRFTPTGPRAGSLQVNVETNELPTKTVVLGDGHSTLDSETYSSDTVSKVTVVWQEEQEDETVIQHSRNYYLAIDGSTVTTPPDPRVPGRWEVVSCNVKEDQETEPFEAARAVFAENLADHKVTFRSDIVLDLRQPLRLRAGGNVYATEVTSITRDNNNDRALYKCGNLATTLTERLEELEQQKPTVLGSSSGGGGGGGGAVESVNGKTGAVVLTASDVGAQAVITDLDTIRTGAAAGARAQPAISDLATIRAGAAAGATALQSYTETDPTVPAWAKAAQKPAYTAAEVGALPESTVIPTVPTAEISANTAARHSHNNKSILDGITKAPLYEHQSLAGKQDVITDLATIRAGAAAGATALQSYTETDPTVPAWAKAAQKPTYTAAEVGALPDSTVVPVIDHGSALPATGAEGQYFLLYKE